MIARWISLLLCLCSLSCNRSVPLETPDAGTKTSACDTEGCVSPICAAGWADCDGLAANGCESHLGTAAHCGGCNSPCASSADQPRVCVAGTCMEAPCPLGMARCGASCVAIGTDTRCAGCGDDCTPGGSTGASGQCCVLPVQGENSSGCMRLQDAFATAGADTVAQEQAVLRLGCRNSACKTGWGDCDQSPDGSCEADFASDVRHCGSCATDCVTMGQAMGHVVSAACDDGACTFGCEAGWVTCGLDSICAVRLGTDAHCKSCGDHCLGGTSCVAGACVCPPTQVACLAKGEITCQTPGFDFCSVCGDVCIASDACLAAPGGGYQCKPCPPETAYCIAGQGCVPIDWAERCGDCDNNCLAGKLQNVATTSDGVADVQCKTQGFGHICAYGCKPGFGDCIKATPGCESDLGKWPHCGGCWNCQTAKNVAASGQVCQSGSGDEVCRAYAKPPATPVTNTVVVAGKTITVPWPSQCMFGYFDCNGGGEAPPLDGCECRTGITWEAPPPWLLDCSPGCKSGSCTCDFNALQAFVCADAPGKCLGNE